MSRKRRRRKPAAGSSAGRRTPPITAPAAAEPAAPATTAPEASDGPGASRKPQAAETDRPRGLFSRPQTPSPFPPFGVTMASGLRIVGSVPVLLGATFVSVLATWGTAVALGADVTLRYLVVVLSASPLHVVFDLPLIFRLGGTSTLIATAALGAVRAVTWAVLLLLIGMWLRGDRDLRRAMRSLPKVALSLFGIYVAEAAAFLAAGQVLGGLLGSLFQVALPIVALHFLSFVPIVIALERTAARDGLIRGFRAARLPAGRHLLMVVMYFILTLYLYSFTSPLSPATPSILGWALVLGVSFLHVGVTAGLAYRWLAVRDHPAVVAPARGPGGRATEAATRRARR